MRTSPSTADGAGYRGCWPGSANMHRAAGSGRWKGPAVSPPGWPTALAAAGEDVVEIRALKRPAVRRATGSMPLLPRGQRWPASISPPRGLEACGRRCGGLATRQAVLVSRTKAINELKSLIVVAPEDLRPDYAADLCPSSSDDRAAHRPRGRRRRAPDHDPDAAVDRRPDPFPARADRRAGPGTPALVKQHPAGPGSARRARRRTCRRRPTADQLVPPRPCPQRSSLRRPRRRRPAGSQQRQQPGTASTAAGTGISTVHCTPSRSPGSAATPKHAPTRPSAPRRARPTATSAAPSSAHSPAGSTGAFKRRRGRRKQSRSSPGSRLTNIGASNGLLRQYFPKGEARGHGPAGQGIGDSWRRLGSGGHQRARHRHGRDATRRSPVGRARRVIPLSRRACQCTLSLLRWPFASKIPDLSRCSCRRLFSPYTHVAQNVVVVLPRLGTVGRKGWFGLSSKCVARAVISGSGDGEARACERVRAVRPTGRRCPAVDRELTVGGDSNFDPVRERVESGFEVCVAIGEKAELLVGGSDPGPGQVGWSAR